MRTILSRILTVSILAVAGIIAANAKVIIPLGAKYQQPWKAKYFYAQQGADGPAADWYTYDFNDSSWGTLQGPISSEGSLSYYNTLRPNEKCRYWVRHHFNIDKVNPEHNYYLLYSHDDECQVYINDILITNQSGAYTNQTQQLSAQAVAALIQGDNVLAMYVNDSGGGQCLDFGLYEDDGTLMDIVQSSDVQISFSNDSENPWWQTGWGEAYNGNRSKTYSTSSFQMTYSSTYPTELKFDWYCNGWSDYHAPLQLYIDGVKVSEILNNSWSTPRFYIEPGDHVVLFHDSIGRSTSYGDSGIRNIRLRQIKPLETAVLTANSQPLTFTNNSATPWTIEEGYIEHTNYGVAYTGASFSTSFTLSKTSKLSFDRKVTVDNLDTWYNREESHHAYLYINDVIYQKDVNLTDFNHFVVSLEPGTYNVEWKDTVFNWNAGRYYYTQVKNIELSNNWVNVELATSGTLGYEALYSPGVNVLTDVEFLKVAGPMNASDWTDIKNMTNLLALDLSEAQITELPNQVFDGKSLLSSVILPEGLKTIGEYAFRGTTIRKMHIPSTVETIKQRAFESTPLTYLTFANNSQINTIENYAFNNCTTLQSVDFGNNSQLTTLGERAFASCTSLKSVNFGSNSVLTTIGRGAFAWCYALPNIQLPNTVTDVSYGVFQSCTSLKSIVFSDAMTIIMDHVCYGCSALEQVHLPATLKIISTRSFVGTTSLKEIDFPSTLNEIRCQAFENSGIERVVLPITMQYLYRYAFNSCKSLKYVELPSYLERGAYLSYYDYTYSADGSERLYDNYRHYGYRYNFQNCTALETVVMRSATPPVIDEDPFNGAQAKGLITLVVPSFAVVNYKLDTYWYQFGSIIEGDDVNYWKVTSPLMLTNNRRMQGKPDVDLYFGGQLTVGGNAPFPMGQFNLYINENDPGRLLNTCENMTADNASVRFAVDANRWYFFTPIYDVNLSDIVVTEDASYVFRYYDAQNRAVNGASGSWKNVDTDKLFAGQGYIFHCNKACEIIFPANAAAKAALFGTRDITRTLTVNEATTTANRSWNYVGNPYPCYYDIYYMDFTSPITVWNGSTYQAYSIADDEFVLRPMQSFFVQKPDAVDEIIFHKEGRQLTTSISHAASVRRKVPANTKRHIFNVQIAAMDNDNVVDETRVVINNQASLGYEIECDAAKFMSFNSNVPQIFTLDDNGNSYSINERPIAGGQVQLAYYAGKAGTYTIRALRADGKLWLYDAEQNCTTNLSEKDYIFQSEATSGVISSRFILTFEDDNPTGIDNELMSDGQSDAWYSIDGRRLNGKPAQRGLYIGNGQKVIIK